MRARDVWMIDVTCLWTTYKNILARIWHVYILLVFPNVQ